MNIPDQKPPEDPGSSRLFRIQKAIQRLENQKVMLTSWLAYLNDTIAELKDAYDDKPIELPDPEL